MHCKNKQIVSFMKIFRFIFARFVECRAESGEIYSGLPPRHGLGLRPQHGLSLERRAERIIRGYRPDTVKRRPRGSEGDFGGVEEAGGEGEFYRGVWIEGLFLSVLEVVKQIAE